MSGFTDDGDKGMAVYKMVDSLIIGYLRKRGYEETEKMMLNESPFFLNRDPNRPFLITTTVNDKHLDDIIETFYHYGRFDAPPELLAMEQQLRDYSNTFTNFVVNYSRANQDRMRERRQRSVRNQQFFMSGAAPRPTYGAMPPRRGFSQLGAPAMSQGRRLQRQRMNSDIASLAVHNGDVYPNQENQLMANGQVSFEQQLVQADHDAMQTDQSNDDDIMGNGSSQEMNQMGEGASRRKSKPRSEFDLAGRTFMNMLDNANAAKESASWENTNWEIDLDQLPVDPAVTCKLLVDWSVNGLPGDGSDPLLQIHEQMGLQDLEIMPESVAPPRAENLIVDSPLVSAPSPVQPTVAVAQVEFPFATTVTHNPPVAQTDNNNVDVVVKPTPPAVAVAPSLPTIAATVAPSLPVAPSFAPRKIDSKKPSAVASESSSSVVSTVSDQTTAPLETSNDKAAPSVSMDELFGDGDMEEVGAHLQQKKNRTEQKELPRESHKAKEAGEKPGRHSSPRPRNSDPIVNAKVTSQERPSSNGSSSSSQSVSAPRAKSPHKTPSSRNRSPNRDSKNRPASPSPRGGSRQDRHRQQERQHQERQRRESDDHRNNRQGGSRDQRNDSAKDRQAARRRTSEDERPPSRSNDQPPHGSNRSRTPPKREPEKNRPKRPQERKEEPAPLKSCLSKKGAAPKSSAAENDVLSNIATEMDNLRKPEKPIDPFPNAPMFGFPIQKLPQIKIPKILKGIDLDKKKKSEEKKDLAIANGFPSASSDVNCLLKGPISDSRLAMVLSTITEKRQESLTSPSSVSMSQAYDSGEGQVQGYNAYYTASMEKSSDTPKSAKRRKLDLRDVDKVMSRIHQGSS